MKCHMEIHNERIRIGYINCQFCNKQVQEQTMKEISCCNNQNIINNKGINVCQNCGIVNSYGVASEYINFHENRHRVRQKSVYQRKHHLENKLCDICSKYNMQISVSSLAKIHQIFIEIGKILLQINGDCKQMISINFIIKRLFQTLKLLYENTPITKSKKTMEIYEVYSMKIVLLIGDKIKKIIKR